MNDRFSNAREAKEFLVAKIVEEARRENEPLSNIERKMLYFTESGWAPPGILEVGEEFDRTYDRADYEKKIAELCRAMGKELNLTDFEDCLEAIRKLQVEDHYILVMTKQAGLTAAASPDPKMWRRRVVNFLACVLIGSFLLLMHYAGGMGRQAYRGTSVTYIGLEHFVSKIWLLLVVFLLIGMLGSLFRR